MCVGAVGGALGGAIYGYGSQVINNLNQGMGVGEALTTNISGTTIALYTGVGAALGSGLGLVAAPIVGGITAATGLTTTIGAVETANVACGGDMCTGEATDLAQSAQSTLPTVYRGLAVGENPANGLWARSVDAGNTAISHVAGKIDSQWISTSKNLQVTMEKWGKNGVVEINLNKVGSEFVDFSNGIPGMNGNMISNWAQKYQEVLVKNYIPPEAIIRLLKGIE